MAVSRRNAAASASACARITGFCGSFGILSDTESSGFRFYIRAGILMDHTGIGKDGRKESLMRERNRNQLVSGKFPNIKGNSNQIKSMVMI